MRSELSFARDPERRRLCSEMGCSHDGPSPRSCAVGCETSRRFRRPNRTATQQICNSRDCYGSAGGSIPGERIRYLVQALIKRMPRRRGQFRVRDPQILLLLPLPACPHRHAPILQTHPVHHRKLSTHESALAPRAARGLRRIHVPRMGASLAQTGYIALDGPFAVLEALDGMRWRHLGLAKDPLRTNGYVGCRSGTLCCIRGARRWKTKD